MPGWHIERWSGMDAFLRGPLARSLSKCRRHTRSLSRNDDLLRLRSFGRLLRSISLNMKNYSPQSITRADSKSHILATTLILGQAPGLLAAIILLVAFRPR